MKSGDLIISGYSGHAYVCIDIAIKSNKILYGYTEIAEKIINPFGIKYLGTDADFFASDLLSKSGFVGIGDNQLRRLIQNKFADNYVQIDTLIHPSAIVSSLVGIGPGSLICANVSINALAKIDIGAIINTGAIVEHECIVHSFAHIGPGAVLCGSVVVGENSFIGANSVIRQGITIGKNVIIGAGSVVVKNIPDNTIYYGNPSTKYFIK